MERAKLEAIVALLGHIENATKFFFQNPPD